MILFFSLGFDFGQAGDNALRILNNLLIGDGVFVWNIPSPKLIGFSEKLSITLVIQYHSVYALYKFTLSYVLLLLYNRYSLPGNFSPNFVEIIKCGVGLNLISPLSNTIFNRWITPLINVINSRRSRQVTDLFWHFIRGHCSCLGLKMIRPS